MLILPTEFQQRMQKLLGEEYGAFEAAFECEPFHALRINPNKKADFPLESVPWAACGRYYGKELPFGRHPYHEAGVYYIQEPSAMAPAEYLEAKPGERILDLCAAPGGKSTQIAAGMQGQGILVCNEIHPARAAVLSENIARMGIKNAVVTNETPQRLAEFFGEYFDKILVDAPCSGEGMFRKNHDAATEWSMKNIQMCAARQDMILGCAAAMLKPGGRLVYSTCTFAPEENEGSVSRFLARFPMFSICPVKKEHGMSDAAPQWISDPAAHLADTVRLFPHRVRGEGHYFAVLQKNGSTGAACRSRTEAGLSKKECGLWFSFAKEYLKEVPNGIYLAYADRLHLLPEDAPALNGLRVLRPGLFLGTNKKGRFEPSHALALFCNDRTVHQTLSLPLRDERLFSYLNGQAIAAGENDGWQLVLADTYSIGWGKRSGGILKNHYPKGLRKNPDFFWPLPENFEGQG